MSKIRRQSLKLLWLETFLAVIEHDGFSGAAEFLGCDQSTVTRDVQNLELWLGRKLFVCSLPLQLGEDGELFKPVAEKVVELLHSSKSDQPIVRKLAPRVRKTKKQMPRLLNR